MTFISNCRCRPTWPQKPRPVENNLAETQRTCGKRTLWWQRCQVLTVNIWTGEQPGRLRNHTEGTGSAPAIKFYLGIHPNCAGFAFPLPWRSQKGHLLYLRYAVAPPPKFGARQPVVRFPGWGRDPSSASERYDAWPRPVRRATGSFTVGSVVMFCIPAWPIRVAGSD